MKKKTSEDLLEANLRTSIVLLLKTIIEFLNEPLENFLLVFLVETLKSLLKNFVEILLDKLLKILQNVRW